MEKIRSEGRFFWSIIKDIIFIPVTIILVMFKKRKVKDLFAPLQDLFSFIFEPKFTFSIILVILLAYFASLFFDKDLFNSLILFPENISNLNLFPLITSGFLHANIIHLISNMAGIFVFGRVVERKLGFWKTGIIYFGSLFISGIFTSIIHLFLLKDNTGGLGASGALMGLIATAILLNPFYLTYEFIIPLPIMIIGWIAIFSDIIGILNPLEDGIGHFAHLGGFISIAALAFFLNIEDRSKLKKGLVINIVSLIMGIVFYIIFIG